LSGLQLSIVHRLPHSYRWCAEGPGGKIEPQDNNLLANEQDLIGLRLLSHDGKSAWEVMQQMKMMLAEIEVNGSVVECEGEPCLFVRRCDESATTCRLKNQGVAIAETFAAWQRA
jgi:hypothetical protein